jgi:hypothetical protein
MTKKKRIYRSNGRHRTMMIGARIDPNSEVGRIVMNLLEDGYSKSEIVEESILAASGMLPKKDSMDRETIINLTNAISRIEKLAEQLSTGAPVVPQRQVLAEELKPEFVDAMKRSARKAFRPNGDKQ